MEIAIGIAVIIATFGGVVTLHEFAKQWGRRNMAPGEGKQILAEIKALREELRGQGAATGGASGGAAASGDVIARLERLQQEMSALRDTTTEFDMSVDAAIERLERR